MNQWKNTDCSYIVYEHQPVWCSEYCLYCGVITLHEDGRCVNSLYNSTGGDPKHPK